MGAILAVLDSHECGFSGSIRKVIKAGGCNCSRANLAGACLGAAYGFESYGGDDAIRGDPRGIPLSWVQRSFRGVDVLRLAVNKFS